mmetsp:Transcript_61371/g.182846  ORF Transcript_61371/g.182846 Transcript_61371/m.182846 type:complete len:846 (+) Transcript_61371:3-2540(+)
MNMNRRALTIGFIVVGAVAAQQFLASTISGGFQTVCILYLADILVCATAAFVLAKHCRITAAIEQLLALGTFLVVATIGSCLMFFLEDSPGIIVRTHTNNSAIWKPVPAIFGFPILPSAVFIVWTLLADIFSWALYERYYLNGDDLGVGKFRQNVTSFTLAVGWLAVAIMNSRRLFAVWDAQEALSAEKALMESIISIMCDATFWLSDDGAKILRSDFRFNMILGRDFAGEDVRLVVADEELERFQLSLTQARQAPLLLPATLVAQTRARTAVELFIVGNRDINTSDGKTPGFLIGVKVATSMDSMNPAQEAVMVERHAHSLAERLGDQDFHRPDELVSAYSSIPETTSTGRIFEKVDIDRWLRGTSGETGRTEELRGSLEKVIALGQKEHWLMHSRDIHVAADQILGAGSFGVVMCGWLHGSPIAVKAMKNQTDSASVEHLVSIANEIRVFRHVRHPNIVLFHGACVEAAKGEIMLVLERVQGPDLFHYVKNHSADTDVYRRFQLLLDVACGLRYLHAQLPIVVHGDLKGSNVLVETAVPRAKLVDFGLSRLLTRFAQPLGGTLDWMAPEVIREQSTRPMPSSDVFSFGRVAYMIVACRKPLEGVRRRVIVEMAKKGSVPTLQWQVGKPLMQECQRMCAGLLELAPEKRPNMAAAHEEASSWTLPDMVENMPALGLAKAMPPNEGLADNEAFRERLGNALRSSPGPPTTAVTSDAGGKPLEMPLVLPNMAPTQDDIQQLLLMNAAMQQNFRVPPTSCCTYHAAIAHLQKVGKVLLRRPCVEVFQPHSDYQCPHCGVLDVDNGNQSRCMYCSQMASTRSRSRSAMQQQEPAHLSESGPDETWMSL